MILQALVEEWPEESVIYVDELPGVIARGHPPSVAIETLPDVIEDHLNWLAAHGFDVQLFAGASVAIAEHVPARTDIGGPLFDADRTTVSSGHLTETLAVAALARRDLVDVYRSVSEFRRNMAPAPGAWSIADHLQHVAATELAYAHLLAGDVDSRLPGDPVKALQASASAVDRVLRAMNMEAVVVVQSPDGEDWTPRKVLRRLAGLLRGQYPMVRHLAHG